MFVTVFPDLDLINVMRLHNPQSAILSAVIFNAIVIVALIPLALRGVRYTPSRSEATQPQPIPSTAWATSSPHSSVSS
nr:hypothetical protein [Mycobacterium tilburgii]